MAAENHLPAISLFPTAAPRRAAITRALLLIGVVLAGGTAQAQPGAEARRNWFDDPFFRASADLPGCPVPLGPLLTAAEMRREAHYRAERGTNCWLEGKCAKANAYAYDKPIAADLAQRLKTTRAFAGSSVWITVQRRFVFVQGCVSKPSQADRIRRFLAGVPDVERVIDDLMIGTAGRAPYPAASTAQ